MPYNDGIWRQANENDADQRSRMEADMALNGPLKSQFGDRIESNDNGNSFVWGERTPDVSGGHAIRLGLSNSGPYANVADGSPGPGGIGRIVHRDGEAIQMFTPQEWEQQLNMAQKNLSGDMINNLGPFSVLTPLLLAAGGDAAFNGGAGLSSLFGSGAPATDAAWGVNPIGGAFPETTGGMSTITSQLNPITLAPETVGGPMSTTAALQSSAAGGGFTGGAVGGLSSLSNIPTSPLTQSAAPVQEGPTSPGSGPGGSVTDVQSPAPVQNGPTTPSTGPGGSVSPLTTASTVASSGSALSRIINGTGTAADWASLAGTIGATGLGLLGSDKQTEALKGISDQYLALGAPSRARLEASYQPGFNIGNEPGLKSAMDTAASTWSRAAAAGHAPGVSAGNPFDNPGAGIEANKYLLGNFALPQLNTYRSQNASQGGLGLNTAGTAALGGAQASGGTYNALGYGLSQLTNPPQDSFTGLLGSLAKTYGLH